MQVSLNRDPVTVDRIALPMPMIQSNRWRLDARCLEVGPEFFHPEDYSESLKARKVCSVCTVQGACLEDALATGDNDYGIRGGLTPSARRALLKERTASQEKQGM